MRRRILSAVAVAGLALCALADGAVSSGAEPAVRAADEQAIRDTTRRYLAALDQGDTKALADFWTADGDFVDENSRKFSAREFIAGDTKAENEPARPKVKVLSAGIRFLTADSAIEDGTTELIEPDGRPSLARGRFTAIWVRQDGQWRIASLREARGGQVASTQADLAKLDWMVGDWTATHDQTTMDVSIRWNATHTFLERDFSVLKDGKPVFSGQQRVGFDPLRRRIRSWNFDAAGGFGDGLWTASGDSWIVQGDGVLPDGTRSATISVFTPEGKDHFSWKSYLANDDKPSGPQIDLTFDRKAATKP